MQNIVVPTLGESIADASIKSLKKKVGEYIKQDEVIALLETDKVAIEVTSPCSGVVSALYVKDGDTVTVGTLIASIDGSAKTQLSSAKKEESSNVKESVVNAIGDSPAAKIFMQENNINRSDVLGTGKDGRITKEDVIKFASKNNDVSQNMNNLKTTSQEVITIDSSQSLLKNEQIVPMSKLRQKIAQRLKESQNNAAILTTFNEINMTNVMSIRAKYKDVFEKKHAIKLGFMSFFVRASVLALKEFPIINAEIRGTDIIFKNYCNIGVAVGTENGLVVPVIQNSDHLSLPEIEKIISNLGLKAKDGKLLVKDMEGGTFTITNGGIYGSLMSTPILNPPQSAILGMHAIQKRPISNEAGEIKVCSMMYVALSYDHRIVDGKEAVTFLVRIKDYVENPERLLLNI